MPKSTIVSVLVITAILLSVMVSVTRANQSVPTGTAFDDPSPPVAEAACDDLVDDAIDRQWRIAAAEMLESLHRCDAFTRAEREELAKREAKASARKKFLLRREVLTQLAEKTTT